MAASPTVRWLWLSAGILAADRASKLLIEMFTSESFHHTLIPGVVTLVHAHNRGMAFGLLADSGARWVSSLLIVTSIAVIVLLAWILLTGRAGGRLTSLGVASILGGAAGNVLDRFLQGSVTDFFEAGIGRYHWPAFNLADAAITIGAVCVAVELLFSHRPAAADSRPVAAKNSERGQVED